MQHPIRGGQPAGRRGHGGRCDRADRAAPGRRREEDTVIACCSLESVSDLNPSRISQIPPSGDVGDPVMYISKLVFSQVIDSLPMHAFRRGVARYDGNRYKKIFSCLDQYLRMTFAQLTHRESLRDIEVCLRAQKDQVGTTGVSGATFPEAPWPTRMNAEIGVSRQISLRH